jgi:CBS domain-containing protein
MTVKAILSRKGNAAITIKPTVPLCDAVKILDEHRIGAAVITDADQQIVGILSERDVVRTLARNVRVAGACHLCDESVGQVMTREVETCTPSDTIHEIMERMTTGKFRHLPVVDRGRLVGIISIGDAVNYRLRAMELESNTLHEYILTA